MLPKKVIAILIIATFLILGYQGVVESEAKQTPNLLIGFLLVGAIHAVNSLKELKEAF